MPSAGNVLTNSPKKYDLKNMKKVGLSRSQQCFGSFNMLMAERCSETSLFRYFSNQVFGSPELQKYKSYEGHLFEKVLKFYEVLGNGAKILGEVCGFLDIRLELVLKNFHYEEHTCCRIL